MNPANPFTDTSFAQYTSEIWARALSSQTHTCPLSSEAVADLSTEVVKLISQHELVGLTSEEVPPFLISCLTFSSTSAGLAIDRAWSTDLPAGGLLHTAVIAEVARQVLLNSGLNAYIPVDAIRTTPDQRWVTISADEHKPRFHFLFTLMIYITARSRGATKSKAEYFLREYKRCDLQAIFVGAVNDGVPKPKNI